VSLFEGRRYLSVVPAQLARGLLEEEVATALTQFDAVLVGGGAIAQHLVKRATLAGIHVVSTYGMSETCGGCVFNGVPLDGVQVEIDDRSRIRIRGPVLFSGYRLRPELTAETLHAGTLITADRGVWSAGRLEVLGRADDLVITGGVNVDLAHVESVAREWPGLKDADLAVLAVPDPTWGSRILAVTDHPDADGLRDYLAGHLPRAALPRAIHTLPIPRTPGGKLDRQRLAAQLVELTPASTA
jgi:o-succinylbenzoate---CoA ligase